MFLIQIFPCFDSMTIHHEYCRNSSYVTDTVYQCISVSVYLSDGIGIYFKANSFVSPCSTFALPNCEIDSHIHHMDSKVTLYNQMLFET